MDGIQAENIVRRILADAQKQADDIRADAERRADAVVTAAEDAARAAYRENEERLLEQGAAIAARRRTVAALECKKIRLAARRAALAEVYRRAEEKLRDLPPADYLRLLERLLSEYAEEGDAVVLSASCPLGEEVKKLAAFRERRLSLSEKRGDFSGGLILEGARYDKNLTFETLLSERRDLDGEIDAFLFGD